MNKIKRMKTFLIIYMYTFLYKKNKKQQNIELKPDNVIIAKRVVAKPTKHFLYPTPYIVSKK